MTESIEPATEEAVPGAMVWDGKALRTIGELLDAIMGLRDEQEGGRFMAEYRAVNIHAVQNVGYIIGYLGQPDRDRAYQMTRTVHPIFGGYEVSVEEVLSMGQRIGQELKDGRSR